MKRTLCASGLFERRYGRDALNNTFGECVVAKANEADCFANAEVQTREEGGILILEYTPSNSCKAINLHPDNDFKFAVKALKTN